MAWAVPDQDVPSARSVQKAGGRLACGKVRSQPTGIVLKSYQLRGTEEAKSAFIVIYVCPQLAYFTLKGVRVGWLHFSSF